MLGLYLFSISTSICSVIPTCVTLFYTLGTERQTKMPTKPPSLARTLTYGRGRGDCRSTEARMAVCSMAGRELTSDATSNQGLCSSKKKRRRTEERGSRKVIPETPTEPSIWATSRLGDPARGAVNPRSPAQPVGLPQSSGWAPRGGGTQKCHLCPKRRERGAARNNGPSGRSTPRTFLKFTFHQYVLRH